MADKEITIKVSTEADTKQVDDLKQMLEAMGNTNIKLEFDADTNDIKKIEAELEEATREVERLEDAYNEALIDHDDSAIEELDLALADARDRAEELQNALKEAENNSLTDTVANVEDLQSAFEEATAEVETLTQTLADIEMGISDEDFDTVNEALQEATEKADELASALQDLDSSGLQEASDNARDFSDSTDQAKTSIDDLNDSMGLIESTMLMDMANQIGALGDQAEGMAQDMNTASISVGQLSTNVGMAEPQMVSLINHISNATFPQEEAMQYVNVLNQMGVSTDKLGDSATNMDRINDATGMGADKVMLLTQGLTALGVSADELPSSFNAIAYAEAKVGGGAETLQQVLRRQAGTLNEYGMGVDATVVALSSLQRQTGLTGMKLGTEFSSRLKECNGDLGALEQSLGLQAGALSNAGNETSKYSGKLQQLANEEAEHKTWIDQINAGWEDMQLALAPVLSPLMSFVGLIGSFGQTALAINALITLGETFGFLTVTEEGLTIAQWTLNASMLANPALWLAIAIIALIGILIYLYYTNEDVRNAIDGLGQAFIQAGQIIYTTVTNFVSWVIQQLQNLWQYITSVGGLIEGGVQITGNKIIDSVLAVLIFMATLPAQIGMIFLNIIAKTLGFGDNFVQNMINTGDKSVSGFISHIQNLANNLWNELNRCLDKVEEWASTLPQKFWDAGVNAVKSFLNALGIHSPGIIQTSLINELVTTGDRIPNESRELVKNIGELGDNIITSFGNPSLNIGTKQINEDAFANNQISDINTILTDGNMGQVNNFYFSDVVIDNEDRMKKIVEYVTHEINWNNKTAGRSKGL